MHIATFGTIQIHSLELIDFNFDYDYGYSEIGKVAGISDIQQISDSVPKVDLKLRYYNPNNFSLWTTEAILKTPNTLIIANVNYGNYYIKNLKNRVRGLIPYISDIQINLWQSQ